MSVHILRWFSTMEACCWWTALFQTVMWRSGPLSFHDYATTGCLGSTPSKQKGKWSGGSFKGGRPGMEGAPNIASVHSIIQSSVMWLHLPAKTHGRCIATVCPGGGSSVFFLMFIYFEREGMSRGEAETVGDRECKAGSVLTADILMWGLNS